jgi:hypothetical protein
VTHIQNIRWEDDDGIAEEHFEDMDKMLEKIKKHRSQ